MIAAEENQRAAEVLDVLREAVPARGVEFVGTDVRERDERRREIALGGKREIAG